MTKGSKDTILGNAGRHPEENFGIINPPVYHASTVTFPTVAALADATGRPLEGIYYGRFGTPTSRAFEEAVAALEGGDKCIALPSGLAAITCALLSFLKSGDHILVTDNAYFPTRKFCDGTLRDFGVETTYFDPIAAGAIGDLMRPETKVVFAESPGSLTFEVQDIPAISNAAHNGGALLIMDNTWSAGLYFDAFAHGVDVSLQAATKYIVGHSDAMLGAITTRDDLYERIKWKAVELGFSVGPDDCYLGLRGLRTLSTRLQRHQETAIRLAEFLSARDEVARVLHPAFPDCPGHDVWQRDFTGAAGLFAVVLKEAFAEQDVAAMLDGLDLFAMGYSWGGFESLILPIDPAAIRTATEWAGPGPAIRIHAGLEDADDLIADLEAGFRRLNGG
jgi:cystathionine beta-lyase